MLPSNGINHLSYTGRMGGTSAATPEVAAVAALVLSVNSSLSVDEVVNILLNSADKVGGYNYNWNSNLNGHSRELGYGRLNAFTAVQQAQQSLEITGPNIVCSSNATFNLQGGNNFTWSKSNNLSLVSSNNHSITVKASSSTVSGQGYVRATFANGTFVQEDFWVGKPNSNLLYFERMQASSPHTLYSYGMNQVVVTQGYLEQEITQYYWDMDASWSNIAPFGILINIDGSTINGGSLDISIKATNVCGTCDFSDPTTFTTIGGFMFRIYPNPTSKIINIEKLKVNQNTEKNVQMIDTNNYGSYELYNFSSNLISKGRLSNQNNIDVSKYRKGMYYLKIISKDKSETHQIIIE